MLGRVLPSNNDVPLVVSGNVGKLLDPERHAILLSWGSTGQRRTPDAQQAEGQ
jgi:hypothetical protein